MKVGIPEVGGHPTTITIRSSIASRTAVRPRQFSASARAFLKAAHNRHYVRFLEARFSGFFLAGDPLTGNS